MKDCDCRAKFIAEWHRKNKNPLAKLNEADLIMKCDVAIHGHDAYGAATVTVWDCKQQAYKKYSQSQYLDLKNKGLVP